MKAKSYYIKTYGCAMNYSDSENLAAVLDTSGYKRAEKIQEADLILLNSCSVRQQAEDKVLGWGMKEDIEPYLKTKFVLTGCMAVRYDRKTGRLDEKYCKSIKRRMPWVDIFMDIKCMAGLPNALDRLYGANKKQQFVSKESLADQNEENYYLESKNVSSDRFRGLFPISVGCDNFCSYCIVPFSRGELEFRSYNQILSEIKDFISKGGKVVTLLGQNVNNWRGRNGLKQMDFADLVEEVCRLEGDFWVSFLSSNPMDFTDKLGDLLVNEPKLMKNLNLAVQSGSNEILRKMNRQYTVERYIEIADSIKTRLPEFRLTTDIIVGFPGETQANFAETLNLLKRVDFDMVYLGKYSKREGSLAAKFDETVSKAEKESREISVKKQINLVRDKTQKSLIGKVIRVIFVGGKRGISYFNHEVEFEGTLSVEKIGDFVDVKVVGTNMGGLIVSSNN